MGGSWSPLKYVEREALRMFDQVMEHIIISLDHATSPRLWHNSNMVLDQYIDIPVKRFH